MSVKSDIKKSGNYRFTPDRLFAIENNDSIYLYILKDKLSEITESSSALSN